MLKTVSQFRVKNNIFKIKQPILNPTSSSNFTLSGNNNIFNMNSIDDLDPSFYTISGDIEFSNGVATFDKLSTPNQGYEMVEFAIDSTSSNFLVDMTFKTHRNGGYNNGAKTVLFDITNTNNGKGFQINKESQSHYWKIVQHMTATNTDMQNFIYTGPNYQDYNSLIENGVTTVYNNDFTRLSIAYMQNNFYFYKNGEPLNINNGNNYVTYLSDINGPNVIKFGLANNSSSALATTEIDHFYYNVGGDYTNLDTLIQTGFV